MTAIEKVLHHLTVMQQRDRMTPAQAREHFLRHYRGVLTSLGQLVEAELKGL